MAIKCVCGNVLTRRRIRKSGMALCSRCGAAHHESEFPGSHLTADEVSVRRPLARGEMRQLPSGEIQWGEA